MSNYYEVLCKQCGHKYFANQRPFDLRDIMEIYLEQVSQIEACAEYKELYEHIKNLPKHQKSTLENNQHPFFHWSLLYKDKENKAGRKLFAEVGDLQPGDAEDVYNLVIRGKHLRDYYLKLFLLDKENSADVSTIKKLYNDIILGNKENSFIDIPFFDDIFAYPESIFLMCRLRVNYTNDDQGNKIPSTLTLLFKRVGLGNIIANVNNEFTYGRVCCPKCFHKISVNSGQHKEYIIGLTGTSGVGKSAYLAALIALLMPDSKLKNGHGGIGVEADRIVLSNAQDESFYDFTRNYLNAYMEAFSVQKTDINTGLESIKPLSVLCRIPSLNQYIVLTFVDMPGEAFLDVGNYGISEDTYQAKANEIEDKYKAFNRADIYWLFLDPTQVSRDIDRPIYNGGTINNLEMQSVSVNRDIMTVLGSLCNTMKKALPLRKTSIPDILNGNNKSLMKVGGVFFTKFDMMESQINGTDAKRSYNEFMKYNGVHIRTNNSYGEVGAMVNRVLNQNHLDLNEFSSTYLQQSWDLIKNVNVYDDLYTSLFELFESYPLFLVAPYGKAPVTPTIAYNCEIIKKGELKVKKESKKIFVKEDEFSEDVFKFSISKEREKIISNKLGELEQNYEKTKSNLEAQEALLVECEREIKDLEGKILENRILKNKMIDNIGQSPKAVFRNEVLSKDTLNDNKAEIKGNTLSQKIESALDCCRNLRNQITERDQKEILKAYLLYRVNEEMIDESIEKVLVNSDDIEVLSGVERVNPIGIEVPFIWTLYILGIIEGTEEKIILKKKLFGSREERIRNNKIFGIDKISDQKDLENWKRDNYNNWRKVQ